MNNICTKYLTDKDFLIHMIDHHQVAVDMSNRLLEVSDVPFMLDFARNISYIQTYEIWIIKMMVAYGIPNISQDNNNFMKWNPNYKVGCYYPNLSKDQDVKCESHFFHTSKKMLEHVSNIGFLEHMIPHHQVAVDMSRRLLLHTQNPHMQEFANEIIKNQQDEIWIMKSILLKLKGKSHIPIQFNSSYFHHS